MTITTFGTMLIYMIISSFTPGPGNILALNTMINNGWKKGKYVVFGIVAGYLTVEYLCTFAMFGLNHYFENIMGVLKYIGAAYLVWLAYTIVFKSSKGSAKNQGSSFMTGFLMQLVNVKIYFYDTTLLSAYIMPVVHELWQLLIIGLFIVSLGSLASFTWAFAGIKLQAAYKKHEKYINIVLAAFLIYCAVNIIRG